MKPSIWLMTISFVAAVLSASLRSWESSAAQSGAPCSRRISSAGCAPPRLAVRAHRETRRMSPSTRAAAWNSARR